jgi:NAD(P)-dependent dehydrogenase (short-subunit alcohol dehydrogenase family)
MPATRPVVVITGAGAGLGRATARAFARRGASVGLIGRYPDRLRCALGEVRAAGARGAIHCCDVADAAAVDAGAETFERELGEISVWVNNAMATVFSPVSGISPEDYRRATEVTYLGAVYGTMAALRRMLIRNRGVIVQVGSALAYRAIPLQAPYCGAKFAIRGFTDALRCELMHDHSRVRLVMVHMPALNTPQFDWARNHLSRRPMPVPPIFEPETGARAIVWAASHERREVYVGLPTLAAIWGTKIAPGLADRYLAGTAYEAQQSPEHAESERPDNLWSPAPGDYAAHGRFDRVAKGRSLQAFLTVHRRAVGIAALAAAGIGLVAHLASRVIQRGPVQAQ